MAVGEGFSRQCEAIRRKMAMTRRGRMLAMQVTLDRGAAMVASLSVEKWAQWTVYFLEVMDGLLGQRHVLGEVREEFLRQVRDSISDRLGADGW